MLQLPEEKKVEIYEAAKERLKYYLDKRDPYDDRVFDWTRLYNSTPLTTRNNEPLESWEHNIFVPYIYATVETIKPRIIASLFNDKNYLTVDAVDKKFVDYEARIRDWYLFKLDGMKFQEKIASSIGESLINPISWQKVILNKSGKDDDVTIDVKLHTCDYLDIWIEFAHQEEINDLCHRIESNEGKLRALEAEGIYENIDDALETSYPTDIPDRKVKLEALYLSLGDVEIDTEKEKKKSARLKKMEVIEWWCYYDIDGNGKDTPIVVSLANREIGIRIDEFKDGIPFFPIRIGKNNRVMYGRPIPQQLEMLQEELNEKRSLRLDNLDRLLKLMYKARRTAQIDWDNLFSAPDNVLLMDDIHNDLAVMESKPFPSAAYTEEDYTKNDMMFTSGAQDYNALTAGAKGTATGISAILSEAATRFRSIVDDVASDILPLIEFIFLKIKKYTTRTEMVKMFGSQIWETITTEELKGNYRIKPEISNITTPNKELRIQLLINLLNVVGRLEGMVDVKEFVKRILSYADIKNIDAILGETPEGKAKEKQRISAEKLDSIKESANRGVEPGMSGPISRLLENPAVGTPLVPTAPQNVQDPFMNLLGSMGANQNLPQDGM